MTCAERADVRAEERPAVLWIADGSSILDLIPRAFLQANIQTMRQVQQRFRAERKAGSQKTFAPPVAMLPILTGPEYPMKIPAPGGGTQITGCGLHAMCVPGNVPIHYDPSYEEFSYLLLVRPGPYRVIDRRLDLDTPQPRGSVLAFRDHSDHGLINVKRIQDVSTYYRSGKDVVPGFHYDHVPAQSWMALSFDNATEFSPQEGIEEMRKRVSVAFDANRLRHLDVDAVYGPATGG